MKLLKLEQVREWLHSRGVQDLQGNFSFGGKNDFILNLEIPSEGEQVMALAYNLLTINTPSNFPGALLWMRDWSMGMSDIDQSGIFLVQQFRRAEGFNDLLADTPGHLFFEYEWLKVYTLLTILLLFKWDSILMFAPGEVYASVSHEGSLCLSFKDGFWRDAFAKRFAALYPQIKK
jgi:hypothetical protein